MFILLFTPVFEPWKKYTLSSKLKQQEEKRMNCGNEGLKQNMEFCLEKTKKTIVEMELYKESISDQTVCAPAMCKCTMAFHQITDIHFLLMLLFLVFKFGVCEIISKRYTIPWNELYDIWMLQAAH